jgi:flagellar motility protein MotE (MotC chaperone)
MAKTPDDSDALINALVNQPLPEDPDASSGDEGKGAAAAVSRFFGAISGLMYLASLAMLGAVLLAFVLMLDFMDVFQIRYSIPPEARMRWPISAYFDFVRLHQLPMEQRFDAILTREKDRYDQLIGQEAKDLRTRADQLEASYKELVKSQQEDFRKRKAQLDLVEVEIAKAREALEKEKADLQKRKAAIDLLSAQLASEAVNVESSLIRFMEEENRLKPVQEMTASMDPRAVAGMFDEVTDNKLIYDILKGIPPERGALILSFMDPEKAGKIVKMSTVQPTLPPPSRSYVPPDLKSLVDTAQKGL